MLAGCGDGGGGPSGGTGGAQGGGPSGGTGGAEAGSGGAQGGGASCEVDGELRPDGAVRACDCDTCGCEDGVVTSTTLWCDPVACTSNDACAPGEYCARPAEDCLGAGECAPIPAACDSVLEPVCGCDGVTYANACTANGAGTGIYADGPCVSL